MVCNSFFPANRIASFRLNAFAKYFHEALYKYTHLYKKVARRYPLLLCGQ